MLKLFVADEVMELEEGAVVIHTLKMHFTQANGFTFKSQPL